MSERLRKTDMLERRPKGSREGSHSRSSDFATSTPSSSENRYPNLTQPIHQFIHKIYQDYYNNTVKTFSTQILQQDYESVTRVLHRFYRQVTYDNQLYAYVFINTKALIPAENSMYIIFHEPTKKF